MARDPTMPAETSIIPPAPEIVEAEPPPKLTTVQELKQAMRDHKTATDAATDAERVARTAKHAQFAAGDKVQKLAKRLLKEQLGSAYDARVVLYNLTGKWED
jgi:hypothetical protein